MRYSEVRADRRRGFLLRCDLETAEIRLLVSGLGVFFFALLAVVSLLMLVSSPSFVFWLTTVGLLFCFYRSISAAMWSFDVINVHELANGEALKP